MNKITETICNGAVRVIHVDYPWSALNHLGSNYQIGYGLTPPPGPGNGIDPIEDYILPAVYIAANVGTGKVVGINVSFDEINRTDGLLSLLSTIEGLERYCRYFEVPYEKEEWPPTPPSLFYPDTWGNTISIGVANVRFRSICESSTATSPVEKVFKLYRKYLMAGFEVYRPPIYKFWRALLRAVHEYNTTFHPDKGLPSRETPEALPTQRPGWENRRLDAARRVLLPKACYKFVQDRGIEVKGPNVKGLIYSPDSADFGFLCEDEARWNGVQVYFDPRGVRTVWIDLPLIGDLVAFTLDGEFPDDITWVEMEHWQRKMAAVSTSQTISRQVADAVPNLARPLKVRLPLELQQRFVVRAAPSTVQPPAQETPVEAPSSQISEIRSSRKQGDLEKTVARKNRKK